MLFKRTTFILALLLLGSSWPLMAQETAEIDADDDVISIINGMPPLHVLIDSAIIHSPYIKFQNAEIIRNQFKIRTVRNNWTKNLGLSGDVIYGTYDYLATDPNTGATTINNQVETRYGTGINIRLPLYDALNRKTEVQIATLELEQADYVKEQKILEIRQLVINQYYRVLLNHRLVSIHNKNKQSTEVQMQLIKKEFTNGQIKVEEYARMTEFYNNSIVDYEKALSELTNSLMILQELVGFKFQF
ncbi:MAG: TolC family protein [Bacteroidetes bacterium]|nr:TolC family protein [Bacteroidota bacterium]